MKDNTMKKGFDLTKFLMENKVKPKKNVNSSATIFKGYNDVRRSKLDEATIVDGKFKINGKLVELSPISMDNTNVPIHTDKVRKAETQKMPMELKKQFLEIISTYNAYQEQMNRPSDIFEVAETLGAIVEAAKELALNEAGDWFDKVTIKRNMSELEKLGQKFEKFATEARDMDNRLHALYEDMGHILNRYYEISDIDPAVMRKRLALKTEGKSNVNWKEFYMMAKSTGGGKSLKSFETKYGHLLDVPHISDAISKSKTFDQFMKNIKQFENKKMIGEGKVTSIPNFNTESNFYISILSTLRGDSKFQSVISKYGVLFYTHPEELKKTFSVFKSVIEKSIVSGKLISKSTQLFLKNNKDRRSQEIGLNILSDIPNPKVADTFTSIIAYGCMFDIIEDPIDFAKKYGSSELVDAANEFVQQRGKQKLVTMMGNL